MRFTATQEDFLRGALLTPGMWYPCVISAAKEQMSKGGVNPKTGEPKDKVNMMVLTFKVTEGEFKGATLVKYYPENMPTEFAALVEFGFSAAIDKKKTWQMEVTPEKLLNKTVDVHVTRGTYENREVNNIDGYRPFTGKGQ